MCNGTVPLHALAQEGPLASLELTTVFKHRDAFGERARNIDLITAAHVPTVSPPLAQLRAPDPSQGRLHPPYRGQALRRLRDEPHCIR